MTIPKTMKALVHRGAGRVPEVREFPCPAPGHGELLVKIAACGICGSDLHAAAHGFAPEGVVMGHEYTGHVAATGPTGTGGWKAGDRIFGIGSRPCRNCDTCRSGQLMQCPNLIIQGYHPDLTGGYAEYAVCQADMSIPVPASLDLVEAAACEPLAVGLAGWRAAEVPPGGSILVVGGGAIGLSVIKWARFFGAVDAAVSEIVPARIERAEKAGATMVVDASTASNPVAAVQAATCRVPSTIFECVGRPILQSIIDYAAPHSRLVVLGGSMEKEEISSVSAVLKNLTMTFSFGYRVPEDLQFALAMMAENRIAVEPLITATVGVDELARTFQALLEPNDHCKVVFTP